MTSQAMRPARRRRRTTISALAVALVLASACGSGMPAPSPDTGLTGTVLRGPIAPVCTPTAPCDAPFSATNALLLRNPTVVNFLDGCALSLPCHEPGTAPVGLSVIGLGRQDDKILRLGAAVEAALA